MTVEGGVIGYGIDEQNGLATALTNVPLAGAAERIQQIANTRIKPPPAVDIETFAAPPNAADGVVVVTVPPSPLAPHYVDERFPARDGATTRRLTEPEIERLYEQRRQLGERAHEATGMTRFVAHPDSPDGQPGVAIMRLLVAPVTTARHPLGAHLERPLSEAVSEAAATMSRYAAPQLVHSLDWLTYWHPLDMSGWHAGQTGPAGSSAGGASVYAVCTHSGTFSFEVSMSIVERGDRFAFEHQWVAELMTCLCIAGTFLADVPWIGIVQCAVELRGLEGAAPITRTSPGPLRRVPADTYGERGSFSARQLARDPREPARELFDRFLASYLPAGTDVVASVAPS